MSASKPVVVLVLRNPRRRQELVMALRDGYEVHPFEDLQSADKAPCWKKPSIVILPDMVGLGCHFDGMERARMLMERREDPVPVILLGSLSECPRSMVPFVNSMLLTYIGPHDYSAQFVVKVVNDRFPVT